jgi:hypothetical protein
MNDGLDLSAFARDIAAFHARWNGKRRGQTTSSRAAGCGWKGGSSPRPTGGMGASRGFCCRGRTNARVNIIVAYTHHIVR